MIMRLNNQSFEAMYCRTENDLTQRISIEKNSTFLYISAKRCTRVNKIFHLYISPSTEELRVI